jgi:hypothetical protein
MRNIDEYKSGFELACQFSGGLWNRWIAMKPGEDKMSESGTCFILNKS